MPASFRFLSANMTFPVPSLQNV